MLILHHYGSIYPDGLETVPKQFAIEKRNKWMVQQSQMAIGYCKKKYGGAYTALRYAKNQKKKVIFLSPTFEPTEYAGTIL